MSAMAPAKRRLLSSQEPTLPLPMLLLPLALFAALLAVSWVSFHALHRRLVQSPSEPSLESSSDTHSPEQQDVASGDPSLWQGYTPEVQAWAPSILNWSQTYQLDPNLIALVMQLESCGNPRVRSSAGAVGLFQVMPFHFSAGEDPFDPETNAKRGLSYLARALSQAANQPHVALAGYNGGISIIDLDPSNWAEETRRYARWGQGILADIAEGMTTSQTLSAWLAAGGDHLCRLASGDNPITMSR